MQSFHSKKLIVLCLLLISVLVFALFGCNSSASEYYYVFGTQVDVKIEGKNAKKTTQKLGDMYSKMDADFDAENSTGSVYRINHAGADEEILVSDDCYYLLTLAKELYTKTNGVFNIATYNLSKTWKFTSTTYSVLDGIFTPPTSEQIAEDLLHTDLDELVLLGNNKVKKLDAKLMIGFGAIAKGYAGDKSFDILSSEEGLLNVGGTIFTLSGDDKNIGITSPRDTDAPYFAKLTISENSVVCTSGDYERYYMVGEKRYCHILGKDGYPIDNGIMSVTILSSDRNKVSGAMCDFLSTAVFALGRTDGLNLLKDYDVGAVIIYSDKTYEVVGIDKGFSIKDTSYSVKNV